MWQAVKISTTTGPALAIANGLTFVVLSTLTLVALTEEEPFFDLTDLAEIALLMLCTFVLCSIYDLSVKASSGAAINADRKVVLYAIFYFVALVTYFGLIWLGFFAHEVAPCSADVVDAAAAWVDLCLACGVELGLVCVLASASWFLTAYLTRLRTVSLVSVVARVGNATLVVCLASVVATLVVSATTSASSLSGLGSAATEYSAAVAGSADWHTSSANPATTLFSAYASLLLALFSVTALTLVIVLTVVDLGAYGGRVLGDVEAATRVIVGELLCFIFIVALLAPTLVVCIAGARPVLCTLTLGFV